MNITPAPLQAQLSGLGALIQLIKRARNAERVEELGFIMVNETHALIPYRQSALWRGEGTGRLMAVSGSPTVDRHAPFVLWLGRAFARLARERGAAGAIGPEDLGTGALAQEWPDWLPAHAAFLPLDAGARRLGVLLLARERPFSDGDLLLLRELADGYAHAWAGFLGRRRILGALTRRKRLIWAGVAVVALAAMAIPIPLSALAPAEVVSFNPTVVRAPLDGVVDHLSVQPNEAVKQGQVLLELDRRAIESRLEIARKALAVAEAEYRQAAQQALYDDKSRAQLAILKGRMDQRAAEASYAQSLLDRIQVTASRDGIAVYDDPTEWIGKPVSIGERILDIADPAEVELEIWLPVADAIALQPGTAVEFFLNVAPDAPLAARLRQTSYQATMSGGGVLGYRLKAAFTGAAAPPRIGLRGTAKLFGERVALGYYLLRRPLAAARQFLGI